jgi:carbamoyltransferase
MPSPGDAGSAIGAVLANKKTHIRWPGAFLGHEIQGEYPTDDVVEHLLKKKICGVANGKAEFGPRALGHRSLLADPRGDKIKGLVNKYKQREPFRPFAPMILAEHAADYFDMPVSSSPYMQFTAKCKYPKRFPAIIHEDNTSRVQTVSHKDCPHVRKLLETWFKKTGCPMLLNTSLNIKGEPLVNSKKDAKDFEKKHKIKVYT